MNEELPSMVKFKLNKEISNKEIEELLLSDPIKANDLYSNENDNEYKAYEIPKDVEDSSGNLHSRFMEEVEKILAEYNEQKKKNTDVKNDDEMHDHFNNNLKNSQVWSSLKSFYETLKHNCFIIHTLYTILQSVS